MAEYLDTSALLRIAFVSPGRLAGWEGFERVVSSELVRVESLRTIDRLRLTRKLSDVEVSHRNSVVFDLLDRLELIPLSARVLERAAQPFPTTLGTLDALHLASALLWRQSQDVELSFCTHDVELGLAARALGLDVRGT